MREFKVVYVNADDLYMRYDGEKIKMDYCSEKTQEAVLNHLASYGWRLVQTAHSKEERFFLYLEREV